MASITVRNLDDEVKTRLRVRAAERAGRSATRTAKSRPFAAHGVPSWSRATCGISTALESTLPILGQPYENSSACVLEDGSIFMVGQREGFKNRFGSHGSEVTSVRFRINTPEEGEGVQLLPIGGPA